MVTQRCLNAQCGANYGMDRVLTACQACGELLDVVYGFRREADGAKGVGDGGSSLAEMLRMAAERSASVGGVWSFKELLPFYLGAEAARPSRDPIAWMREGKETASEPLDARIATIGEGRTVLQRADALAKELGFAEGTLHLQYEGFNPTGSFKDNGMAAGFTHARMVGAKAVACASTGNTSASLAAYASRYGIRAFVFVGNGKIAFGKLSQALDYGATTLQVAGDFDTCLSRVRTIAEDPRNGVYLLNSVNPFRLEGQKTIMLRVLRDLMLSQSGRGVAFVPDWIVVPGGNLGNCSAFAKTFIELHALGLIDRVPRLAVINASGASTLDRVYNQIGLRWTPAQDPLLGSWNMNGSDVHRGGLATLMGTYDRAGAEAEFARMDRANEKAHTVASAIEINRPVNLAKALRALWAMNGVVRSVSDDVILWHKAMVGRWGLGCEPASAASVAGAAMLRREGVIGASERVVCILTGHQLKDPDATVKFHTDHASVSNGLANAPRPVADDLDAIRMAMGIT